MQWPDSHRLIHNHFSATNQTHLSDTDWSYQDNVHCCIECCAVGQEASPDEHQDSTNQVQPEAGLALEGLK